MANKNYPFMFTTLHTLSCTENDNNTSVLSVSGICHSHRSYVDVTINRKFYGRQFQVISSQFFQNLFTNCVKFGKISPMDFFNSFRGDQALAVRICMLTDAHWSYRV